MHVDFLTLACLRDDLDSLLGARVQHIVLPDDLSVGLELYALRNRHYLFLSAHPQHARVLLIEERLRRGREKETPLLLLLRKWLRGARLCDIVQPAWERMLVFHFQGFEGPCQLVAEVMDRYSNLVLVGPDGRVLDATKRVGPDLNRRRVTLPGQPYQMPPPPANRAPPVAVDWAPLHSPRGDCPHSLRGDCLFAEAPADQRLHHTLTGSLRGVSPTLAREAATRAAGDPLASARTADPAAVGQAMNELLAPLETGTWEPHVGLDDHGAVIAFTPYRPRQFSHVEPATNISEAMMRFFAERLSPEAYAAARQVVRSAIVAATGRIDRALARLAGQLVDQREIEILRENGELLLAYQQRVTPGADRVSVPDHNGNERLISLDPALSALENAQACFRRYAKARRAATATPARVEELNANRAYLEQMTTDLALARTRPEIDAVRDALAAAGWMPPSTRGVAPAPHRSAPTGGPERLVVDGFTIIGGRNARQNDEVTFKQAAPDDLWFHVRGQPGPHVIVKSGGREVPDQVMERAAGLAVLGAAHGQDTGTLPVDVTRRRFVHRAPGGHPGMVTYRNERTLWVKACAVS